jgi:arylsulfatase
LYDTRRDFSEARDLAGSDPAKLSELQALFWREAARGKILPIHAAGDGSDGVPSLAGGRNTYSYSAGVTRVPESAAPHTLKHSFGVQADVVVPAGGASGVLVTQGGRYGGYAFYVHQGQLVFHYNALALRQYNIRSSEALSPGPHLFAAAFMSDGASAGAGGTVTLSIDGRPVARGRVEHTLSAWMSHTEGFDVGEDTITPINDDYAIVGSKFSGELKSLRFTVE